MTSRDEIATWFDRGVSEGCRYMIVVCDSFDHDDYPVYVQPQEDFWKKHDHYDGLNMQRIMEVYDLQEDKAAQMSSRRVFNLPPRSSVQSTGAKDA